MLVKPFYVRMILIVAIYIIGYRGLGILAIYMVSPSTVTSRHITACSKRVILLRKNSGTGLVLLTAVSDHFVTAPKTSPHQMSPSDVCLRSHIPLTDVVRIVPLLVATILIKHLDNNKQNHKYSILSDALLCVIENGCLFAPLYQTIIGGCHNRQTNAPKPVD